jgi:ubiquinone/menaquinone biosynthesis C-methylase UbiE
LVSSLTIPANHSSKLYYDAVGESYDDLYTDGISLAENSFVGDLLIEVVAPGAAVLDLGCGSGLGYELLSAKNRLGPYFSYYGVDISIGMINEARKKFTFMENARFDVMNMEDLAYFKNESFDSVISLFGSFSHAIQNDQAVREIQRILRPGGTFFIMTYSRKSLRNLLKCARSMSLTPISNLHDYEIRKTSGSIFAEARFYTPRSLTSLFSSFQNLRVRGLNAMLELPLIHSLYRAPDRWTRAKTSLRREMRFLSSFPGLAHSLIITGRRP